MLRSSYCYLIQVPLAPCSSSLSYGLFAVTVSHSLLRYHRKPITVSQSLLPSLWLLPYPNLSCGLLSVTLSLVLRSPSLNLRTPFCLRSPRVRVPLLLRSSSLCYGFLVSKADSGSLLLPPWCYGILLSVIVSLLLRSPSFGLLAVTASQSQLVSLLMLWTFWK